MIYIINIIILFIYKIFINSLVLSDNRKNILYITCSTIHLLLFHALRNPFIYPDNEGYSIAYYIISEYNLKEIFTDPYFLYASWEKGYVLYNYILSNFFNSSTILFISTSCFIVLGFMFLVYKWSSYPCLSVLLYVLNPMLFYTSLFVLRQHIAIIFVLLSIYYIYDLRKSFLLAIVGVLFHSSAIIIFPFYIFNRINIEKITLRKMILWGGIIIVLLRVIIEVVFLYMPRYAHYADETSSNFLPFIVILLLFLLHYWNGSYKMNLDYNEVVLLKYLVYATFICTFTIGLAGGGRLTSYFMYSVPFLLPLLFKYNNKCFYQKILYTVLVFTIYIRSIYISFSDINSPYTTNYQFFWENIF